MARLDAPTRSYVYGLVAGRLEYLDARLADLDRRLAVYASPSLADHPVAAGLAQQRGSVAREHARAALALAALEDLPDA